MAYAGGSYTSSPYAGTVYEPKRVLPLGGIPNIVSEVFIFVGPQVGVRNLDGSGRIRGNTVVTGNLTGGVFVPPPDTGGGTGSGHVAALNGDIVDFTVVKANLSGGRPVIYLVPVRTQMRTFIRASISGGTQAQRTYLFGQNITGRTRIDIAVLDGGEEALIIAGRTAVTADMSGGVATKDLIPLQGYPIVMSPPASGSLSGGRAVIDLQAFVHTGSSPAGSLNAGAKSGVKVFLAGRPKDWTIITANLTGGKGYQPPPPDPVPGTGKLVLSGDIRITITGAANIAAVAVTGPEAPPDGPSDLPTDVDGSVPSNPKVELLESIGFGQYGPASEILVDGTVHLCGEDVHTPDSPLQYAIKANSDGTPSYSYERWVRVRFVPPFGLVGQFRFWVDPVEIPDGWNITWGWAETYKVPTNAPSEIAISALPTFDPGIESSNFGPPVALDGRSIRYTAYLVLQAYFVPPLTHEGDLVEPLPGLTYNIAFVQS